jgi:antitoxin (DNA-binding transcriptional repressor) of toxin-antitoxin stability system
MQKSVEMIGIRELHAQMARVSQSALEGQEFIVIRNSKPVFKIVPYKTAKSKAYSLKDVLNLKKKTGNPDLSKQMDALLYS